MKNKFDAAASMLENVVSGPFSLVPNFGDIFLQAVKTDLISIEIQYSNQALFMTGATQARGQRQPRRPGLWHPQPYRNKFLCQGWSTNLPTQNLALLSLLVAKEKK
jgi:hypothetical protein